MTMLLYNNKKKKYKKVNAVDNCIEIYAKVWCLFSDKPAFEDMTAWQIMVLARYDCMRKPSSPNICD
jgi:hypothetical protein